jgi:hypothetical protein
MPKSKLPKHADSGGFRICFWEFGILLQAVQEGLFTNQKLPG